MLELKFAIYYRAASLPSQDSTAGDNNAGLLSPADHEWAYGRCNTWMGIFASQWL